MRCNTACIVDVHITVLSEQLQVVCRNACTWELPYMVPALGSSSSAMAVRHVSSSGSSCLLFVLLGCRQHQ
jgi:hypothetical protein